MKRVRLLVITAPFEARQLQARVRGLRKAGMAVAGGPGTSKNDVKLTRRQTQVLLGMSMGRSTSEIAHELKVARKTIETHRQALMSRLGIYRVAELVRYALRRGVLPASWLLDGSRARRV